MALEMRDKCEKCNRVLQVEGEAYICSFECTFCGDCTSQLMHICPNCGGELVLRPRRRGIRKPSAAS
ncbi:MAG TPA: DUF1272 domain-containing protein [bacterium]|nr:DUF1272 domain-containing protein [bacterium]